MFKDNLESARNLKFILSLFEQMSGLNINFHKSDLFCFGKAKGRGEYYASIFTCVEGKIPFRYLGVPLGMVRLSNSDWKEATEKMEKKDAYSEG